MKTSIAISLLALVAPICAVPMEALDPRHLTFSDLPTTISLPFGPPVSFPTGSGFPPFPTTLSTQTHHHRSHKTGGFHPYPTGGPFPTGTRPHRAHPHPTGGYYGIDRREPEGANGPRYDIHSSFLAALITYTTTGPKPPLSPRKPTTCLMAVSLLGNSKWWRSNWYSWHGSCANPFFCPPHFTIHS